VGVGSFDPRFHVREPTVALADRLERDTVRYQGNWIPHQLRSAVAAEVFFVGDSAGHCLPLTAEGIRTAFYFGIACGRELRRVVEGRASRETALRRYGAFSDRHEWAFRWMLRAQRLVPRVPPPLLSLVVRAVGRPRTVRWAFQHYLDIAHPSFADGEETASVRGLAAPSPGKAANGAATYSEGDDMSIFDKITGRAKKAAGDLADDPSLRREGRREERKGEAKEEFDRTRDRLERKADEVADLERRT
jgi:uncharacterized protein YjbJ (UPF0337 family)